VMWLLVFQAFVGGFGFGVCFCVWLDTREVSASLKELDGKLAELESR